MLPLVLLPGMDGTGLLFEPFLTALGHDAPVEVVRYPNHIALGYAELEALARHRLPSGPFILLAESFSGPIAISMAASVSAPCPTSLAGLVLVSTFARDPRPWLAWMSPWIARLRVSSVPRPLVEAALLGPAAAVATRAMLHAALAQVEDTVLKARWAAVRSIDLTGALPAVRVPVLSLYARGDRLVPRQASALPARLCANVRERVLDGPHALLQICPDETAAAVRAFVRDVEGHLQDHPLSKAAQGCKTIEPYVDDDLP